MANKKASNDLPYNLSAEMAVLGSALLSRECLFKVLSQLDEGDFFSDKHKALYSVFTSLNAKSIEVDVLTVTEELMNLKQLDFVGGVEYLRKCSDSMVALGSLEYYLGIVKDQSVLRKTILACREIESEYMEKEIEDISSFVANAESKIKDATAKRRIAEFHTAEELSKDLSKRMNTPLIVGEDNCTGLTTGYGSINRYTTGFHAGDMVIIAARPSVGKTALALNIAYRTAKYTSKPVAIFSLEMTCDQLMERLLGISSHVSLNKIKTRHFDSDREKTKINASIKELSNLPIYIDDTSSIKFMDIVANTRRLQSEHPDLGLVIVDYLGLITTGSTNKNDNRQEEVRKISLGLKNLAKELKLPIIAVSQLSRTVEQRGESKRPMLSDLRDSGSIEQDADVVMLLYREDYYRNQKGGSQKTSTDDKKIKDMSESERFEFMKKVDENNPNGPVLPGDASLVDVSIAKNRNGQVGPTQLFFYKEFGLFDEPTKEWIEQIRMINEGQE